MSHPKLSDKLFLFEKLLNHFPWSIFFKDEDGKFVYTSRYMAKRSGLSSPTIESLKGKSAEDLYHERFANKLAVEDGKILVNGDASIGQVNNEILKDGTEQISNTTKVSLKDDNGNIIGIMGIAHNISEELHAARSMVIQAEENAMLSQFTAGLSHELNNPISIVKTGTIILENILGDLMELLELYNKLESKLSSDDLDEIQSFKEEIELDEVLEELTATIADVKAGANRAANILKGLGDFNAKKAEKEDKILADIHEGLDSTLTRLYSRFGNAIKIVREYDETIEPILCFPGQLNQVFFNIIINALEAMEETGHGEIKISTKIIDHFLLIHFKDTGIGMTEETRKQLFEPLFTTKENYSGLGLSIAYGICERHGGKILVKSAPEKGSIFTVVLPISQG
ncbi:MAG: PAS domain S-box protein [Cyclobacteriaceae bacterium]